MAKFFDKLSSAHQGFILEQHMFFVATADVDGRVNLSPKGLDTFRILSPTRVAWLNLTGSGNETAAHLLSVNRMTMMFCAFQGSPLILRLYGTANTIHPTDTDWAEMSTLFPTLAGARQIFDITIESVQTSCGYAVPEYAFEQQRQRLLTNAEERGDGYIKNYWQEKNTISIDGKPTGMPPQ